MRVFMLGWEFPPFISGGLGTACYGLTRATSALGTDILFVLPRPVSTPFSTHVRLVSPRPGSPLAVPSTEFRLHEFEHVTFRTVNAQLSPYNTPANYQKQQRQGEAGEAETDGGEQPASATRARRLAPAAAQRAAGAARAATPGFIGSGAP